MPFWPSYCRQLGDDGESPFDKILAQSKHMHTQLNWSFFFFWIEMLTESTALNGLKMVHLRRSNLESDLALGISG